VPGGSSGGRFLAHPIDRTNVTHIMTSTRRLRRVESENQIWLVIPNHCAYGIEQESEMLIHLHDGNCTFFFFFFFLDFIGKAIGGTQVRTEIRETARERVHREVVHAPRYSLKRTRAGKVKGEKGSRVGIEGGTEKVKACWWLLRYAGILLGRCTNDTIVLLSARSHTSLCKGKHVSLVNYANTPEREGDDRVRWDDAHLGCCIKTGRLDMNR
jgi:hypothetical protein